MHTNYDPFGMVKISEQIDMVSSLADNSKSMNRIKKEIVQISEHVDEMESQNNEYMVQLNNPEQLVLSRTSMNDIDTSSVTWDFNDYFDEQTVALDNQVVGVRDVSEHFNLQLGRQKARLVVIRVNDMCNHPIVEEDVTDVVSSPKLVIVPKSVDLKDDEFGNDINDDISTSLDDSDSEELLEPVVEDKQDELVTIEHEEANAVFGSVPFSTYDSDMFETVIPFEATPMFTDRTDEFLATEDLVTDDSLTTEELESIGKKQDDDLDLKYSSDSLDQMPDAFWITQEEEPVEEDIASSVPTFDEQVSVLLNNNSDDTELLDVDRQDVKKRKLEVARKSFGRKAA